MRQHLRGALLSSMIAILFTAFLGIGAQQPGSGRGPAGPPQLTPRLADGTPNLGRVSGEKGVWNVPYITNMGERVIEDDGKTYIEKPPPLGGGRGRGTPAAGRGEAPLGGGEGTTAGGRGGSKSEPQVPFQPWAAAVYDYHSKNESKYDPEGYCLPPGGPRLMATPYPMEIIQLPEQKRIVMIFEGATHIWREIFMDGRPHPRGDELNPTYLGHSVGRWEGDTLVVDVVGFNEQTWMDYYGHPHTDMLHVVEKYSRPTKNTLAYEATFDDPGAYTKPWNSHRNFALSNTGFLRYQQICSIRENQQFFDNTARPAVGTPK